MSRKRATEPPKHLSTASKRFWREMLSVYELEPHDLVRLESACQSFDRWQAARAVLDEEGTTYEDRFGVPRSRPEVAIERDSRLACLRSIRELGLDYAGSGDAPRLPLLGGQKY